MTTYKFLASDSASAMEEVVKKLGPDALIIATTKKGNKVEIEATNNVSSQQKARDNKGNFSDVLHSKIDFLREKQRNRIYKRASNDFEIVDINDASDPFIRLAQWIYEKCEFSESHITTY